MIEGSDEQLRYMQLGIRLCVWCHNNNGVYQSIYLNMEDTKAIRREVRTCDGCGVMSIGEPVPPVLEAFFNQNPEEGDTPNEERIAA